MPDNITFIDASKYAEAYEAFARGQRGIINQLYENFHQFNQQHWNGTLPRAIIRVPSHGMTRRTLGRYTRKTDQGEEHLIEINKDFIVLNTWERVLETLKHEMIHLHLIGVVNEHGCKGHGKRFKEEADRVSVPCHGSRGYGNPANMPQPKTAYAEWKCACGAVNVRCSETRTVAAICDRCWSPLKEDGYTPGEFTAPVCAPIHGGQGLLITLAQALETRAQATARLSAVEAERDHWKKEAEDLFVELLDVSFTAIMAYDDPLTAARRRAEATADLATRQGHDEGIVHRFARIFAELDADQQAPIQEPDDFERYPVDLELDITLNGKKLTFNDEQDTTQRAPADLEPNNDKTTTPELPRAVRQLELD